MNACRGLGVTAHRAGGGRLVLRQFQDFLRRLFGGGRLVLDDCAYLSGSGLLRRLLRRRGLASRGGQLVAVSTPITCLQLHFLPGIRIAQSGELVGGRQLKNLAGLQPVHVLAGKSFRIVLHQQHEHLLEADFGGLGRARYLAQRIATLDRAVRVGGVSGARQRAAFAKQRRLGSPNSFHRGSGLGFILGRRLWSSLGCSGGGRFFGFGGFGLGGFSSRSRFRLGLRRGRGCPHFDFGSLLLFAFGNDGGRIEKCRELPADPAGRPGQLNEQIDKRFGDGLARRNPHIGFAAGAFFNTHLDAGDQGRIGQARMLECLCARQTHGERTNLILFGNEFDFRLERFAECRHDVKLAETCRVRNRADRQQGRGDYPRAKRRDAQSAHPDRFLFEVIKITSWI